MEGKVSSQSKWEFLRQSDPLNISRLFCWMVCLIVFISYFLAYYAFIGASRYKENSRQKQKIIHIIRLIISKSQLPKKTEVIVN